MNDIMRWTIIYILWGSVLVAFVAFVVNRFIKKEYMRDWSLFYALAALAYTCYYVAYIQELTWLFYGYYLFMLIALYFFAAAILRFSKRNVPDYILPSAIATIIVFLIVSVVFPGLSLYIFFALSMFIYIMCGLAVYIHERTWLRHFGLIYVLFALSLSGYLFVDTESSIYVWVFVINLTLGSLLGMSLFVMHYFKEAMITKKHNERLHYLSYHDPLTSLHNRTYLEESVMDIDKEKNLPLALLIADLDNLKKINDKYGHRYGDMLLAHTGNVLTSSFDKKAIITRYGGDEFVIIAPVCSRKDAEKKKKLIINKCENIKVKGSGISLSIGIAIKETMDQSIMHIFDIAEDDMYKQKQNRDT